METLEQPTTMPQGQRLHELTKSLREKGLNAHLAYLGAQILAQDELIGIRARTLEQSTLIDKITLLIGRL